VRFLAVSQGIDTDASNPVGKLILHVLGAVAEFERELICDRVRAGLSAARLKGRIGGRPRRVYNRTLALELHAAGNSFRQIAGAVGVGVATVKRLVDGGDGVR
jgi:DNA invertase Pin-like site-specific DNA recombinase